MKQAIVLFVAFIVLCLFFEWWEEISKSIRKQREEDERAERQD
jgi:hypothetical protein